MQTIYEHILGYNHHIHIPNPFHIEQILYKVRFHRGNLYDLYNQRLVPLYASTFLRLTEN